MKTTFSSGVIVTSQWLNGAKQISFDGQDLDWHYPPLGLDSFITAGPNGLDSRYITLTTPQPNINYIPSSDSYSYVSGIAISGDKVVTGIWNFGYEAGIPNNPANVKENAPRSYTTNDKYDYPIGYTAPTIPQKFSGLNEADIITKKVLREQIEYLLENLVIDNGYYYYFIGPDPEDYCTNYSLGPTPNNIICGSTSSTSNNGGC